MPRTEDSHSSKLPRPSHRDKHRHRDGDRVVRGRKSESRDADTPLRDPRQDEEPRRTPSIDPKKPRKPKKPSPPSRTPTPPPPPPPPSEPSREVISTSSPSYYQNTSSSQILQPASYDTVGIRSDATTSKHEGNGSPNPLAVRIRVNNTWIKATIDDQVEESFISEEFAINLRSPTKPLGHKRTYRSRSGTHVAKSRIKADISLGTTVVRNTPFCVLTGKLDQNIILGKQIWASLRPRGIATSPRDDQYTSDFQQLPQAFDSLSTAEPTGPTTSSPYYPPSPQPSYAQMPMYGDITAESRGYSTEFQSSPSPGFDAQSSHQGQSSYPRYASSNSERSYAPSTFSTGAAQGGRSLYPSSQGSSYTSEYVAPTSNTGSTTVAESAYIAQDHEYKGYSDENYTHQPTFSRYEASQQSPRQETSPSETFYSEPNEQVSGSKDYEYYATVPKWEYHH